MAADTPDRRLAAILSADVVGYGRLMAQDEDATVRTLGAYREQVRVLVDGHRGRIVDFTGDNFLAEFPAALDAVRCAIEIQRVLEARNASLPEERKLLFRIGINLGDIREEDGHLYGDGINIAARLEALADPGGICLSEAVHAQVQTRVDVAFVDMGPQELKNLPNPVRAYRVRLDAPAAALAPPPPRPARPVWPAVVALVLAVAGVLFFRGQGETPAPPPTPVAEEKPSIAVLPFVNMSGDDEREYFADGMTEDLITDLSKISGLRVIARTSVFYYKGRHVPVQQIADELKVAYLLEGSVRKMGENVRINAQLIDAGTGHHLWSERFDRPAGEIFALQDDVMARIVEALSVTLTDEERARTALPLTANLEAYDLYLRALSLINLATRETNAQARDTLQQAIALDDQFATAYGLLSFTYLLDWMSQWTTDPAALQRCEEFALKAVALRDSSGTPEAQLAMYYQFQDRVDEAIDMARQSIAIAPNLWGYQSLAMALSRQGRGEEALAAVEQAMRLDPHDRWSISIRGSAYLVLGRYKDAARELRRSATLLPDMGFVYLPLALAYEEIGEQDNARWAVEQLHRLMPNYSAEQRNKVFGGLSLPDQGLGRIDVVIERYWPAPAAGAEKPAIAVLPFANMSGDPEQEYFADGMTEDLITDLSKISGLLVIARNSVFTYKGKPTKVQDVARDLDVQYIVEGSVRKMGDQVRITAQLVDGATGHHLWSDRYDGAVTDLFGLQDDVREEIVSAMRVTLTEDEHARTETPPTANLDAYDLYLRAQAYVLRQSRVDTLRARELFERAIALDPGFALAHRGLAITHFLESVSQWSDDPKVMTRAIASAERAVALDPALPQAHAQLGRVYMFSGRHDEGLAAAGRAVELGPNDAAALGSLGEALYMSGRAREALAPLRHAVRLDPQNPFRTFYLGAAHVSLERFEEGIGLLKAAINRSPDLIGAHLFLASAYAETGDMANAQAAVAEILRISPGFTVAEFGRRIPFKEPHDTLRSTNALRRAGLPEGEPAAAAPAEKPAIAVLPFANMSGDPEQEYFADGMTEDLITDLSKISGLLVIARNSVFTYKGKPTKVQDVARDLNVQYVLEGSVRKAGNRVRITAQLVDGATGHHLWSERYDRELTDIFALQDEVTQAIVAELRVALTPEERAQLTRIPTADPEAYDLYLRGVAAYWIGTAESVAQARTFLHEAVARDPTLAEAHALLARTGIEAWANQWTRDPAVLPRARERAEQAMALEPHLGYPHAVVGAISLFAQDFDRAEAAAERAYALEPRNPAVLQFVAHTFAGVERYDEALELLDRAVRLDPSRRAMLGFVYGATYALLRRFEEAIVHLREFVTQYPNFVRGHALLARTYAEMGELAAAHEAAQDLLRLSPDWTVAGMAGRLPYRDPAVRARVVAAYLKAGLPEGEPVEAVAAD